MNKWFLVCIVLLVQSGFSGPRTVQIPVEMSSLLGTAMAEPELYSPVDEPLAIIRNSTTRTGRILVRIDNVSSYIPAGAEILSAQLWFKVARPFNQTLSPWVDSIVVFIYKLSATADYTCDGTELAGVPGEWGLYKPTPRTWYGGTPSWKYQSYSIEKTEYAEWPSPGAGYRYDVTGLCIGTDSAGIDTIVIHEADTLTWFNLEIDTNVVRDLVDEESAYGSLLQQGYVFRTVETDSVWDNGLERTIYTDDWVEDSVRPYLEVDIVFPFYTRFKKE